MNKSTKKTKFSYIVNLDEIEHLDDIAVVFTLAKHNAGLPLSDKDIQNIVEFTLDNAAPKVYLCAMECNCTCEQPKRKPWYKRFWNWLFGRK